MILPGRLVVKTIDTKDLRLEDEPSMAFPNKIDYTGLDVPVSKGEVRVAGLENLYSAALYIAVEINGVLVWKSALMADSDVSPSDGLPYYA